MKSANAQAARPGALAIAGIALVLAAVTGCGAGSGKGLDLNGRPTTGDDPGPLVAELRSIQDNVLTPFCTGCHVGSAAPLGLRLDAGASFALLVNIASVEESGIARVKPGDPDNSYLIQKLEGTAGTGARMPLGLPPLPQSTIDVIRAWITAGALPGDDPSANLPPAVVATTPDDGALVPLLPAEVQIVFSAPMDASLVSDVTVRLVRAGLDGGFDDGNEVVLTPSSLGLSPDNTALLLVGLGGVASIDDDYRLTLVGTGATALAGIDGQTLDGDGDGNAGGDFVALFAVSSIEPTLESIQANVFTTTCAFSGCHSGPAGPGLPTGQDLSSAGASFASLVGVASIGDPDLQRVAPGDAAASYLIRKLEGTAGAQMPLGGQPLPWPTIDVISQWIDNGALFDGEPADVTPPTLSLNQPASPVGGTVALSAVAADNVGVTLVEFFVDGLSIGGDTVAPFAINWDSASVSNGVHELLARASDAAGNTADSAPVQVTIDNTPPDITPPSVSLTAPVALQVSGLVTVAADASDDIAVDEVRFYVDQLQLGIDSTPPYALDWDTTRFADGDHVLSATAVDTSGNTSDSQPLTVTVDNQPSVDVTPPVTTLTAPAAGVVNGVVTISADASDDTGVTEVRFFADVDFIGADATTPYSVNWDTTMTADGSFNLTSEAVDAAGNTGFSDPVVVTVENTPPDVTPPSVSLTAPVALQVSGLVTVAADASDDVAVTEVRFFVDQLQLGVDSARPYALEWDTRLFADGDHVLSAIAVDSAGNTAESQPLTVTVDNQPSVDVTPPVTILTAPAAGVINGVVTLSADASDDTGVTEVRFFAGVDFIAADATAPYSVAWDTTMTADGVVSLTSEAVDAAGNTGISDAVIVTIENTPPDMTPPSVSLTAPVALQVSGLVTVAADASDDVAVAEVRFFVDQAQLGTDSTAPYALDWDTTQIADGDHVLSATAVDSSGNMADSQPLTVTVDNQPDADITPPVTALTAPPGGFVNGVVMLSADASDDTGVTEVRFFAGVDFIAADATPPYSVGWDTTMTADGVVNLTTEAVDAAGNTGFSDPVAVTVDNTAPTVLNIDPANGAMQGTLPDAMTVTFSEAMAVVTISATNVRLQASGGDGTFADGNEVDLQPAGIGAPTDSSAVIDLTGVAAADDTYRLTLFDAITDIAGLSLDGDGDAQPGGAFTSDFTISSAPTYTVDVQPIFAQKCAPCHTGAGFGGHNIATVYGDAFLPADDSDCDGLNVGQCTIVRIQSGEMPLGRGCTGDPVQDAARPACLTQAEQDTVQAWINAGLPE